MRHFLAIPMALALCGSACTTSSEPATTTPAQPSSAQPPQTAPPSDSAPTATMPPSDPSSNPQAAPKDENATIGSATMQPNGTIVLMLRAEDGHGAVGDAQLFYAPSHADYQKILKHVGPLKPGESKPVKPFPPQ